MSIAVIINAEMNSSGGSQALKMFLEVENNRIEIGCAVFKPLILC